MIVFTFLETALGSFSLPKEATGSRDLLDSNELSSGQHISIFKGMLMSTLSFSTCLRLGTHLSAVLARAELN